MSVKIAQNGELIGTVKIARNGEDIGTYDANAVAARLQSGYILGTDYFWTEGMERWQPVKSRWHSDGLYYGILAWHQAAVQRRRQYEGL